MSCSVVHLPIAYPEGFERPRTEGDCPREWRDGTAGGCPMVSCTNNLFLDVDSRRGGGIRFAYKGRYECPTDVPHSTCAVHWGERGPLSLEEVGAVMGGITRERVRQLEMRATSRFQARWGASERGVRVSLLRNIESAATRVLPRGFSLIGAVVDCARAHPGILQIDLVRSIRDAKVNKVHTTVSSAIKRGLLVRRDKQIWLAGEEPSR